MRIIDISLPFLLFFFFFFCLDTLMILITMISQMSDYFSFNAVLSHQHWSESMRGTQAQQNFGLLALFCQKTLGRARYLFFIIILIYKNIQKYFLLKHRKKLAVTLSLQMQNSCKPTFSPEGAKNIYPGLLLSSLLFLCLQHDNLPLTYTQTFWEQRVAEPLHLRAVFSLL